MPIYKYSRHEVKVRRAERRHRRMRLVAVVVSGLLLAGAVMMMAGRVLTSTVRTVLTPMARPFTGAALGVGGR